jgi:inhibitor of cysteine peptidase
MRTLTTPRVAAALLVLATLLFTACGSDAEPAEGTTTIDLTAADAGRTLSVHPGDEIVVTLDSNATTGFAWQMLTKPASEILDLVKSEYVAPDTELVGAGGEEVWRFVATGQGSTHVAMTYARSFSGETAGEPFDFTVVVQPAA